MSIILLTSKMSVLVDIELDRQYQADKLTLELSNRVSTLHTIGKK
jgi:hypothetical protein